MKIGQKTMSGIVLHTHGGPDNLQHHDRINIPIIDKNEILINIKYCGINHLDLWLRKGGTGDRLSLPRIPGSDIVGKVIDKGEHVAHLEVGDYVVVYPGRGCGKCNACISGRETLCKDFEILGYHFDGGYTEYIAVDSKRAFKISEEDIENWSAVPVAYVTAWNALVTKGNLSVNDTVVIWGASGGLGYAALSIVKGIGAKAIGIVGDESKIQFLKKQGFDDFHFITRNDDVAKKVRELTGKQGADLVLDHVGSKTFQVSLRMLKRGGHLAFCGVTTGPFAEVDLRLIFGKQITIAGSWMGDLQDFAEVVKFLEAKKLFPHIDKVFTIQEAASAHRYMESEKHIGKIVLVNSLFGK